MFLAKFRIKILAIEKDIIFMFIGVILQPLGWILTIIDFSNQHSRVPSDLPIIWLRFTLLKYYLFTFLHLFINVLECFIFHKKCKYCNICAWNVKNHTFILISFDIFVHIAQQNISVDFYVYNITLFRKKNFQWHSCKSSKKVTINNTIVFNVKATV